jgi:ABC-type nitrate/sulfonate/bicarbonate transport system ATPase subunit
MDDAANPKIHGSASKPRRRSARAQILGVDVARKGFGPDGRTKVLGHIAFEVLDGEVLAILGPSGSGKTTLLRMIAGLDLDYEGVIRNRGSVVRGPDASRGLVFQDARLLPWRTVRQNVAFGLPRKVAQAESGRVEEVLRLVGLADFQSAWPRQLSGGMEKRAALARALVSSPDLLLLDEPFGALDLSTRLALQSELVSLRQRLGLTVVIVTHDIEEAVYLGDRILILDDHPAQVVDDISVPLPHPRDRTGPAFEAVRLRVLASVLNTEHRRPQS